MAPWVPGDDLKKLRFKPISDCFHSFYICGSPDRAASIGWMSRLFNICDPHLKEGMTVLDYGCGSGRFGNFISGMVQNFKYYGLEPRSSHGTQMIEFARIEYKDDRMVFDYCGSDVEKEAISKANVVILSSVFTHTSIEETYRILDLLLPVIMNGGVVIFTVILGNSYSYVPDNSYDLAAGCKLTYNTNLQYVEYANRNGCDILVLGINPTAYEIPHYVLMLKKK